MSSRGRTASPRRKTGASPVRAKAASPARATSPRRGRPPKSVTADAAAPAVAAPAASATHAASPAKVDHHKRAAHVEFGGPVGTALIMIFSHVLLYYVYYVLRVNKGNMWFPTSVADLRDVVAATAEATAPTLFDFTIYLSFILVEAIFAMVMPGLEMRGRPDASGSVLTYRCNAYLSWFATLGGLFLLHWTGFFPLQTIFNRSGRLMTVAVIFADSLSAVLYIHAFTSGTTFRMMGNHVYDFFMGASLHPRIGVLDIKMFAEIRMSWFLLFVLTISAAAQQWAEDKVISSPMWLLIYAHFLYANACAKGEHYVPATWDISYEKFGWMLCFWNFAGVPFLYCKQSVYLALKLGSPLQSPYVIGFLLVVLTAAYYVWDTAQSQKNHFRLQFSGVTIHRNTQPQLPWRTLDNPMYLTTAKGTPLLIDGWWAYARKIHYTCDVVMALCWALTCGFQHFIPYLYVAFFVSMITHRYQRDVAKCAREYGADWDRYVEVVPYTFIPGLI